MRLPTRLLRRKNKSNKGDYGHIFILAGSTRFLGAAVLCGQGALRSGAGLVTLGVPESLSCALLKIKPPELMSLGLAEGKKGYFGLGAYKKIDSFLAKVDVLAIGPGLGLEVSTQKLVRKIIAGIKKPAVIDADAINSLAGYLKFLKNGRKREFVLTPHPGEMARMLQVNVKSVQASRREITRKFTRDYKLTLVLKGWHTLVSGIKGELYVNKTGNPGMATAGSGDVLTGMIAAFLGQGLDEFNAAKYAVYLHGLAADLAAEEKTEISLIASDIIDKIPEALKKCS